jgi:hypothetical protein
MYVELKLEGKLGSPLISKQEVSLVIIDIIALNLPRREKALLVRSRYRELRLVCIVDEDDRKKLGWKEYAQRMGWKGSDVTFPYARLWLDIA